MTERFGLAIVGAGLAAAPHAQALTELKDKIDVRGVVTKTRATLPGFCARYGFPQANSLDALLNDPKVDAVLVLTPPDARREIVERAAQAGKHLLVEKPLERTAEAARGLVEICNDAGVKLGVVFQHRFRAASAALNTLIQSDALGRICSASLSVPWWRDQRYYDEPGRGTYARDGGGVLMTQAIHAIDLMLSCTGPARAAQAICATTMHRMEAEDFAAAAIRFESGAVGSLMATVTSFPGTDAKLTLNCARATAILEGGRLEVSYHDGRHEEFCEPAPGGVGANPMDFPCDWHRSLIENFAEAVRDGRHPTPNGRDALHAQNLIDAITRSSASGNRVRVT